MRMVDDRTPGVTEYLKQLHPHTGKASILGITGNPGSGKSTLTDQLIRHYRAMDLRVGVIAVDPSSPFSGGAILGDRIRMMDHATDPNVFIRSVATRGTLGGLSRSTHDMVHILDAMGHDVILVETVGVGQDEIDVMRLAHTSMVVLVPGLGDDIQAIKAGILEIADIFVINKADNPMVDRTIADLRHLQSLVSAHPDWLPPITTTIAIRGEGIDTLTEEITRHRAWLEESDTLSLRTRDRERHILETLIRSQLQEHVQTLLDTKSDAIHESLSEGRLNPYTLSETLLSEMDLLRSVEPGPVEASED
jgi:LAO/AO transport system kinase